MKTIDTRSGMSRPLFVLILLVTAGATFAVTALLTNIFERKSEARSPYIRVVEVTEDTTDPAVWGLNWPRQYDSYLRTELRTATRFGGHGGSEALPEQKIERDPWIKRMFLGYAFSLDYRDRRGHAYMLVDQEETVRITRPQSGSCLHCHSSVMPLYRHLGDGDAMKGFRESYKLTYQEANAMLHDLGHAHPVSCVDCHDPESMQLRVTRPGFIEGIRMFAESGADEGIEAFPSIAQWRTGSREVPYDPNKHGTRNEMRSFVCGQCHVEYYCATAMPLEFPWGMGLTMEQQEAHWNEKTFPDGRRFFDFVHAETGAEVLKAQHPEFELWSQGVHARSGVSCADCHMPYMRDGATKVSDHWVRSPLLNVNRACQTCHNIPEKEILSRVDKIQDRNYALQQRAGQAVEAMIQAIVDARTVGATPEQLKDIWELQRKAQWRLDFMVAENSMGFHAPQEAARILGEAIDYARQAQLDAQALRLTLAATAAAP
ncbi:MAG TPA: ammonia-forming cytochrome c nitrite reductase subunit c552 [Kiritimatiellia bacterium]|nr:ammonia-forming cytochrome c nitrite reductase subunit c552 [Kiritimatiellia bacterium]HMP00285.1 ammonia-forming cytochrome c nitrite reductase subunit c552 [Kiritimatiellia bacterium]